MSDSRTNRTRKQARHLKEQQRQSWASLQTINPMPTVEAILWPDEWLTPDERKGNR
jgi:hypothetical protein